MKSIHGLTFYGHGGAYDCDVCYCPEEKIGVCLSRKDVLTGKEVFLNVRRRFDSMGLTAEINSQQNVICERVDLKCL
ncbi:MAG: hypothetical protein V2A71_10535 [Candidatus Eisenbacteria bacterium]